MMCVYTYIHMYIVYIHEVVVSGTHFFYFCGKVDLSSDHTSWAHFGKIWDAPETYMSFHRPNFWFISAAIVAILCW